MHGATIKILFIIFYQFCSKTECPIQKLRNKSLQEKKMKYEACPESKDTRRVVR